MNDSIQASDRFQVRTQHRPVWIRLLLLVVLSYFFVLILLMFFENSLVFRPAKLAADVSPPLGIEEVTFKSPDGLMLHGWYAEAENPHAVILLAHGNAGNVSHRTDWLNRLRYMGANVLVFDYRGFGRSEGRPSEPGILADARAARAWLAERNQIDEQDVVLLGESLGGGVVVQLAAQDGARALILEHTFTSLPDAAAYHYPWVPVRLLMRNQLNSQAVISKYQGPLLQLHGDADHVVPYELGQRLFEAANEPKEFVTILGGDHNDMRSEQAYAAVQKFLDSLSPK